jgi:hypothetical protein
LDIWFPAALMLSENPPFVSVALTPDMPDMPETEDTELIPFTFIIFIYLT